MRTRSGRCSSIIITTVVIITITAGATAITDGGTTTTIVAIITMAGATIITAGATTTITAVITITSEATRKRDRAALSGSPVCFGAGARSVPVLFYSYPLATSVMVVMVVDVAVAVMMVALDVLVPLDVPMTVPMDGDAARADVDVLRQGVAGCKDQRRSGN
ncbi:conserved membrane protein of unknown function [Methylorubrum extorquens]|uniref:Uncharacterized protein n=1 Tax=Methylorubrum extorquens TaxID=408 RepID=A0A2N9ATS9_METEX|nr:conserved membrane protein of unknown function [Methylorubrum extorquens]